jgi:hypothetical protein
MSTMLTAAAVVSLNTISVRGEDQAMLSLAGVSCWVCVTRQLPPQSGGCSQGWGTLPGFKGPLVTIGS